VKSLTTIFITVALMGAFGAQLLRWARVLQREHYESAAMRRFLERWTSPTIAGARSPERFAKGRPVTLSHVALVVVFVGVITRLSVVSLVASLIYGYFCPVGLSVRGRTAPLHWTKRMRLIVAVSVLQALALGALGLLVQPPYLLVMAAVWGAPFFLAISVVLLTPLSEREARGYITQAQERLARIHPRVVGITGSYGKTSTKNHLLELMGNDLEVVATPKSFNNRAGLSRAINEQLSDGTQVFIAEMGTYGPGEIRDLCGWCSPEIAIVTAIGPVHLERMGSIETIVSAKREITEHASTVILNVDEPRLAQWIPALRAQGKKVISAGTSDAEVSIRESDDRWTLLVRGEVIGQVAIPQSLQATNVACAAAAALELGVTAQSILERIDRLQVIPNRANVVTAPSGVVVIDDTFNANPASATASLHLLDAVDAPGRKVVVTPGLIELGDEQYRYNARLAEGCRTFGFELCVVGRTNARALLEGFVDRPLRFDTRPDAVKWVRSSLHANDAVLYLNDLPDHYP
jgi:UDP-N-acetylmuramoyl-tripeptide--D-alanyl-D-alanine ligase